MIHTLTKGNTIVRFRIGKDQAEVKSEIDGRPSTSIEFLSPTAATTKMNDMVRKQGYVFQKKKTPAKAKT
jgi:hypothetical protein